MIALGVGVAAGLGAVTRYLVDRAVQRRSGSAFPWGTFAVNVSGSLLLGLVSGLVSGSANHGLGTGPGVVLSAGFCSGYTTWSTFAWETVVLARGRALLLAAGYVALSVGAGLAAAGAGFGFAVLCLG